MTVVQSHRHPSTIGTLGGQHAPILDQHAYPNMDYRASLARALDDGGETCPGCGCLMVDDAHAPRCKA